MVSPFAGTPVGNQFAATDQPFVLLAIAVLTLEKAELESIQHSVSRSKVLLIRIMLD